MEGYDVCGNMTVEDCHNLDRSQRIQSGPERLHRTRRDFKKMNDRLETFVTWPPGMPVEPKILADAGLVYLGKSCFLQVSFSEKVTKITPKTHVSKF